MKFLYRVSLFFLIASAFFSIGLFARQFLDESGIGNVQETKPYEEYAAKKTVEEDGEENTQEFLKEAAVLPEAVVTGDFDFIVQAYDMGTKEMTESQERMPPAYIGLSRGRLEEEIEIYSSSPTLQDLEKGFISASLESFSGDKIVIRKNYDRVEEKIEDDGFYLMVENNYVTVYESDRKTVYQHTEILIDTLPEEIRKEVENVKYIEDEAELYNFLESYSS